MLVNDLVDTAGISFAYRICEDVGVDYVDAVRTYVATEAIFGIGDVWRRIRRPAWRTTSRCRSPTA